MNTRSQVVTNVDLRSAVQHGRPVLNPSNPDTGVDLSAVLDEIKQDLNESVQERAAAHGLYAPPPGSDGIYVATSRLLVHS